MHTPSCLKVLALIVLCLGALLTGAPNTSGGDDSGLVRIKLAAIDPAIARLTNKELIDRLQDESKQGIGTHATAWISGFLPLASPGRFEGGIFGSRAPSKSLVMTELVRRGVDAMPDLLEHLSDSRPTKLKAAGGFIMAAWFSDEYAYRYDDPARQPPGVNTVGFNHERSFSDYTLKVGDLCFVAIGQIVDRGYSAMRYQPTACLVVNSPIEYPSLAAAARADWAGLTKEQHEQSLLQDAVGSRGSLSRASGAIPKLLYYYPGAGRRAVEGLLNRHVFDEQAVYSFILDQLALEPERQATLLAQFRKQYGRDYYNCLEMLLRDLATDKNPDRATERQLAAGVLSQYFKASDSVQNPGSLYVSYYSQNDLVALLAAFDWKGLDASVFGVYRAVSKDRPPTVSGRLERGDLALNCAKRLLHKGHDREFSAFFVDQINQLRRDDEDALRDQGNLPRGNAGNHFALAQRIKEFGDFVHELGDQ